MEDIIDKEEEDRDTLAPELIEKQFTKKYNILTEKAISLNKSYINKLHATKSLKLAISLQNNSIEVYELNNTSLNQVCKLSGHAKGLTEVVFSPKEDYLIYSSGQDGVIKLWDTRASGTCAQEFKEEDDNIVKPYECMDISQNGRVLCAGTSLVEDDATLVFWDQRQTTPLGGYWNSHTDDITQVKFHKEKTEVLATGAVDGLINVFNILETSEDDALAYTLNVENSVEKISWLDDKTVACITQSNDVQLWDIDTGDMLQSYDRDKIARSIKRSKGDDCYVADAFPTADGPVLLAGSYAHHGSVLRSASCAGRKLVPSAEFADNKQVVRASWHHAEHELLVTAGESGLLSVWSPDAPAAPRAPHKHHKRHRPY